MQLITQEHKDSCEEGGRVGWLQSAVNGNIAVHFDRTFSTGIEHLWKTITDKAELNRWSPGFRFTPQLGAKYELWFAEECSGPAHIQGHIEALQEPNLLQLGTIIFQLEATPNGCHLHFSDTLVFSNGLTKLEVAIAVLAGWHRYLDLLEQAVTGQAVDRNIAEKNYADLAFTGRHLVS